MKVKKAKSPVVRRRPVDLWGDLDTLCKKARRLLYTAKEKSKARQYATRLEKVLSALPVNDLAIIREEGLALLAELQGKFDQAIAHRKREIDLIKRLHVEARSPRYAESTRAYMLRGRSLSVLRDRKSILESLQNGKLHASNGRRPPVSRRA